MNQTDSGSSFICSRGGDASSEPGWVATCGDARPLGVNSVLVPPATGTQRKIRSNSACGRNRSRTSPPEVGRQVTLKRSSTRKWPSARCFPSSFSYCKPPSRFSAATSPPFSVTILLTLRQAFLQGNPVLLHVALLEVLFELSSPGNSNCRRSTGPAQAQGVLLCPPHRSKDQGRLLILRT